MRRLNLWFVMWFIWAALSPVSTATAQEMPIDETSRLAAVSPAENDKDCVEAEFSKSLSSEIAFDIPITINERVEYFINYFQTEKRKQFCNWLSRSTRYLARMRAILRENGLPEDLVYLAMIESGFNVNAYSRAHACGPWQFIKGTAGRYGLKVNHWLDERRNPEKATKAAASYLRDLYEEFGCWYLAAAGYNAGENKVRRGITTYETADFWDMCDYDLFAKETKNYVPQMIAATIIAKNPEKYGFTDVEYQQPVACVKVSVPPQTYLEAVALACGVDCQTIRELNAEFKRGCTPPSGYSKVNIPASTAQLFRDNFDRVKTTVKTCYRGYVVQRGDTAAKIARKFGISRKTLLSANKIKGARSIKKGNVLQIPYQVKVYALSPRKLKSITKIAACTLDGDEKRTGLAKRHGGNKKANVGRTKMKYHRVRKGDTIWNIAQKYNVTPADIRSWNNIDTNVILPGARLKVRISSAI